MVAGVLLYEPVVVHVVDFDEIVTGGHEHALDRIEAHGVHGRVAADELDALALERPDANGRVLAARHPQLARLQPAHTVDLVEVAVQRRHQAHARAVLAEASHVHERVRAGVGEQRVCGTVADVQYVALARQLHLVQVGRRRAEQIVQAQTFQVLQQSTS